MSQELIYTSAPRGLKPGSHGFCTVVSTQGIAVSLVQRLESLSGYRHVFPPQDPNARLNPVIFSHLVVSVAGRRCHVLSRVCDAGLDHTQRTNKFAHHVVLDPRELVPGGPAWLLAAPGFMQATWDGVPRTLAAGRQPPATSPPAAVCRAWQQIAGDAGWGGVLAETACLGVNRPAVIIFHPGVDPLPLLVEALALLPPSSRWEVSFSTYFNKLPPGLDCQWRCVLEGSPEAIANQRLPGALVIDLGKPPGRAPDSPLVQAARTGVAASLPAAPRPPLAGAYRPSDAELGRLLSESAADSPAAETVASGSLHSAISSVAAGAEGETYDFGPPPRALNAMDLPQAGLRPFKRKRKSRWPIFAAFAATVGIAILAFVGWQTVNNRRATNAQATASQGQEAVTSPGKSSADSGKAQPDAKNSQPDPDLEKKEAERKQKAEALAKEKAELQGAFSKMANEAQTAYKEARDEATDAEARKKQAETAATEGHPDVVIAASTDATKFSMTAGTAAAKVSDVARKARDLLSSAKNKWPELEDRVTSFEDLANKSRKCADAAKQSASDTGLMLDKAKTVKRATDRVKAITDVLRGLDDKVLALPLSDSSSDTASLEIVENSSLSPDDYAMELQGCNDVFSDSYKLQLKPKRENEVLHWYCNMAPKSLGDPKPVAVFFIRNNKLYGKRLDSELDARKRDLLCNCLLRMTVKNSPLSAEAVIRLRMRVENPPIKFSFLSDTSPETAPPGLGQVSLIAPPEKVPLLLQCKVAGAVAFKIEPESGNSTFISTQNAIPLYFRISLWNRPEKGKYQVTVKYLGLKLTDEQTAQWEDLRPKPKQSTYTRISKVLIDQHSIHVNQIYNSKCVELHGKDDELSREKDPTRRELIQKEIGTLKERIEWLSKQKEDVEVLLKQYDTVTIESKLEYRVYVKIAGHDVDLARTTRER